MRAWNAPLVGLVALHLTGCAYSAAMRHGDKAAAAGDWRQAVVEYQRAVDAKDKPEAVEAWTQARDTAIQDALDRALTSIETGQYESAVSDIDYVAGLERDNADVFSLRTDARKAMIRDIETHWSLGNARTAYGTAVRMRALFPQAEEVDIYFDRLRDHYAAEAEGHLKAREFGDALASARTITEFEPARADKVAPLEHRILTSWADDLGAQARVEARANRKGAAAMLYARAYEIAGRQTDLGNAQDLAGTLAAQGRFDVDLRITGAPDRAAQVRGIVGDAIGDLKDVGDAARPALTVTVTATGASCKESREARPESRDYVSGQREVPNPEYAALSDRLARAKEEAARNKAEAEALFPEVKDAEVSVAFFDGRIGVLDKALGEANGKIAQAEAQLQKIVTAREGIEAHLVELRAVGPGTEATIAHEESQLGKLGALTAQWQGEVLKAQDAARAVQDKIDRLQSERVPADAAFARLQSGYQSTVDAWTSADQLASATAATLANTPKTVMEDVPATLAYDVVDWTRTCTAPLTVAMKPSWTTQLPTSEKYTPSGETKDTAHIGHALAGLDEDPKAYPVADAEMIAAGDAESARQLGSWIAQMVEEFYEVRSIEVTMAMQKDPARATDRMLALYLGAPAHVDEATALTFRSWARDRYGVESLELLRSEGTGQLASNR